MDSTEVALILSGVVCGCCLLLCLAVIWLCIKVRRISRDVEKNRFTGAESSYADATSLDRKRTDGNQASLTGRYVVNPNRKKTNSAYEVDPGETCTYVPDFQRPPIPTFSNAERGPGGEPSKPPSNMEYVNKCFIGDESTASSSIVPEHPIYTNEQDQPVYQNCEDLQSNVDNEPIYANKGELAGLHNPELERSATMTISQIS